MLQIITFTIWGCNEKLDKRCKSNVQYFIAKHCVPFPKLEVTYLQAIPTKHTNAQIESIRALTNFLSRLDSGKFLYSCYHINQNNPI